MAQPLLLFGGRGDKTRVADAPGDVMQSNLFRVAVAIVGGLSLSSAPLVAAPAAADQPAVPRGSCTCRVIGGGVFFQSMSVSPDPSPAGERLVLSFDLTAFVYSGPNFQSLTDSAGLLEVVEVVRPFGSPVVAVRASAPGATEVSVTVSYGTEEECTCADGSMFFQIGPTRTETSRGFPLAVTSPGAPTPTPTPTVVPTPTAT